MEPSGGGYKKKEGEEEEEVGLQKQKGGEQKKQKKQQKTGVSRSRAGTAEPVTEICYAAATAPLNRRRESRGGRRVSWVGG